ncbi:50S ribosomal protein L4 [Demequina litorisediminis]|nr:50S ribosomal protein L4 [Demequina litorisediminis]
MAETQTVDVLDAAGKKAGTADLPAEVFDVVTNVPLIHQVVVAQRAAARQGTHATKTRGEVAGGGKKPYKQKGTGRARQGSIRAPQFAGGGVVHGPQPRDYSQRTPKKMKAAALRGALSDRARAGRVHVLQGVIAGETPRPSRPSKPSRTSPTAAAPWWSSSAETSLAFKSLRNAAWIHVIAVDQINTYDVLVNDDTVFTAGALEAFLAGPATGKSATAVATESEAEETK